MSSERRITLVVVRGPERWTLAVTPPSLGTARDAWEQSMALHEAISDWMNTFAHAWPYDERQALWARINESVMAWTYAYGVGGDGCGSGDTITIDFFEALDAFDGKTDADDTEREHR